MAHKSSKQHFHSKLKNLGWKPKFDLDYGFNLAFNWYFDNYNTWLK